MQGYSGSIFEDNIYLGHKDLTVPYFINCCGYLKASGLDVSLKRTRDDFYLVYLTNGTGHYRFNDESTALDAGSIILYKPGQKQDYYYLGNEKAELYWIHFTGFEVGNSLKDLELFDKDYFRIGVDTECINIFENIIHEIQIQKPHFHKLCIGYLLQLLSLLSRKAFFSEKGEGIFKDSNIENAIKCMNKEYLKGHPISFYAQKCNLSVYQFIRNFKSATKLPPAKYLEKLRIAKAKELLCDTALTISEISYLVGYNDPFYFSKVFKKTTDITPSYFREKHNQCK